ncbi:MAG: cation-efflux pump [Chlorobi bacterium]|nr:cation-efflux pump [Chlorobiota bacterium]
MNATKNDTYLRTMRREKTRVAISSIIVALALTGAKLAVGLWTGSLGILSEAAHSGLDLVAALITYFAVRIADRPPDKDHHFGHGKIENLSALLETLLLLVTCGWIIYEAIQRLIGGGHHIEVNVWSFAVIILAIIADISRSRALMKVANKYNSQALHADALHFQTDIWSSSVVLAGLAFVLIGFPEGDAIAALFVSLVIIYVSIRLGKKTLDTLIDRVPSGLDAKVQSVVTAVQGVEELRSLRLRQAGSQTFVDTVIGIQRTTSFDDAHAIMSAVEDSIHQLIPRADVIVHAEPVASENEDPTTTINWIVGQFGLMPHNIALLRLRDFMVLNMDIEFPHGTGFQSAHDAAEQIEKRIKDYFPEITRVCIHMEEARTVFIESRDVTENEASLVNAIKHQLEHNTYVLEVETVRCYLTGVHIKVNVSCKVSPDLSLEESHLIVDAIEMSLAKTDQRIKKVFVHAEPLQ